MRIFALLKEMCLKLGLIADYIVETGHSGDWTWQKYASGIVTLFGTHAYPEKAIKIDKAYGAYYYASKECSLTLPFNLVNYAEAVPFVVSYGVGVDFTSKSRMSSANTVSWWWCNGSPYETYGATRARIQISGYWKTPVFSTGGDCPKTNSLSNN